jgi:hypothetical protein
LLKQKGYIGSIGDDLPSLVPLLFGLMMFFAVFSFTLDLFNEKKLLFDREFEVMRIADGLRYNGYIVELYSDDSTIASFNNLCSSLIVSRVKYVAGLTNYLTAPLESGVPESFDVFSQELYYEGDGSGIGSNLCSNVEFDEFQNVKRKLNTDLIIRIYPVVLEENRVAKPMHLVVVAWI